MEAYPPAPPAHSNALSPAISHIRYPAFSPDAHPHIARRSPTQATSPFSSPSSPSIRLSVRRSVRSTAVGFAHQLAIRLFVHQPARPPVHQSVHSPVRPSAHPPSRPRVREYVSAFVHPVVRLFRPSISAPSTNPPQPIVRQLFSDAFFANLSPYCYRMTVTSVLKPLSLAV